MKEDQKRIFVTGATGYIGGRLVPRLLEKGYRVRCLTRSARKLAARPWADHPAVEIFEGDASAVESLRDAMRDCQAAYYLIHSMVAAGSEYASRDREIAQGFAEAAEQAGVERIFYLGGLGEVGDGLSEHLRSRREVEGALASRSVPVTVLRAAMIIGAGSASFETLRYIVERLPVMITPRWVRTECQPIGIRNVLHYLIAALETPETSGQVLDIGGPDVLSYEEIIELMAEAMSLPRRIIIPVPVLTPRLSSLWIHWITPINHRLARPLAEGLRNRVVARNDRAQELMPQRLSSVREAIEMAVGQLSQAEVETSWSDAGPIPGDPDWAGGTVFEDVRRLDLDASPSAVFRAVCRIGGGNGWYAADFLWKLRGAMDRLIGGPGLRRGRRNPERIGYGDALDFWRVTGIERDRHLALRAEMKLPGKALLQFDIEPGGGADGTTRLIQTARFKPRGLLGLVYWYAVLPLHGIVFRGMMEGIRREAEKLDRERVAKTAEPMAT